MFASLHNKTLVNRDLPLKEAISKVTVVLRLLKLAFSVSDLQKGWTDFDQNCVDLYKLRL